MARTKAPKKWGAYRVQVRGQFKWTTLRRGYYFGEGYWYTKEQAQAAATQYALQLNKIRGRTHRIVEV